MTKPLVSFQNISKEFSGIKVLKDISFTINSGEVHALMGENGAGKSTLMKILMGLYQPTDGNVIFEGQDISKLGVHESLDLGIAMIHQELLMIPELTIAQNIFLGREPHIFSWLKDGALNQKAKRLFEQSGINLAPKRKVNTLSIAEKQMVEIVKAISQNAKLIIMDEPTSALSDDEVDKLFKIIQNLKKSGVAVIYISHKMSEIFQIADKITVLRDGEHICTKASNELNPESLIQQMVGREIKELFPPAQNTVGEKLLEVKNIGIKGKFQKVSFSLMAGEVLGLAGLMGAGRTEVARAIAGFDALDVGQIEYLGEEVTFKSPKAAIEGGIAYVSEDRKELGFIPELSIAQNLSLSSMKSNSNGFFINTKAENSTAEASKTALNIKGRGIHQSVRTLSGGNQQKVVIGKVLRTNPKVIILDEPTRGIDVGAKTEIYKLIRELSEKGIGVILISSELPEILGLCDRVVVLSEGSQKVILSKKEATQENIMQHAVHS
ncbi:inositol transport system ATP-binding protein [Spirosomataceae bacterium TFI 002]|nr:inositol transport system ATP-binding protein [Spirosomataceae bacterium TFI 002]